MMTGYAEKKAESEEMVALREEARHWKRQALKARAARDAARARADAVARPRVEVRRGETYWRVYVNDQRIDGFETEGEARGICDALEKAFAVR